MVAGAVGPRRLVFMDEMSTNTPRFLHYTSMLQRDAPRREGPTAYAQFPRNRGANTALLASMSLEEMGPSLAPVGTTTATVFEAYVGQVRVPSLRRGQIVVL